MMNKPKIITFLKQINWGIAENKAVADQLIADTKEYIRRVEDHIYTGNEIRAELFMDVHEKQDEIERLGRRRTVAHDKVLKSFAPFLALLEEIPGFEEAGYELGDRTQIAAFVAMIAFELMDTAPVSKAAGKIRDELAEKIHLGTITYEQIYDRIKKEFYNEGLPTQDKMIENVTK